MHTVLVFFVHFWGSTWRFAHSFVGMVALGSWFAAPVVGGVLAYRQNQDRGRRSLTGLWQYLFPADLFRLTPWRLDAFHQITKLLLRPFVHGTSLLGMFAVASLFYAVLTHLWGAHTFRDGGVLPWIVVAAIVVLAIDAGQFYVHYLEHKFSVLWELHKVHHSSEQLLLMFSNRRAHPFEEISSGIMIGVFGGAGAALGTYAFGMHLPDVMTVTGRVYLLLNALSFYHLRHSHLKLGYGWLERWVISPSQHHIHHAYETHLWDKNFGWLLSIWDRMHGTLVYSWEAKDFPVGLPRYDQANYDNAWKLLFVPVRRIAFLLWNALNGSLRGLAGGMAKITSRLTKTDASREPVV